MPSKIYCISSFVCWMFVQTLVTNILEEKSSIFLFFQFSQKSTVEKIMMIDFLFTSIWVLKMLAKFVRHLFSGLMEVRSVTWRSGLRHGLGPSDTRGHGVGRHWLTTSSLQLFLKIKETLNVIELIVVDFLIIGVLICRLSFSEDDYFRICGIFQ